MYVNIHPKLYEKRYILDNNRSNMHNQAALASRLPSTMTASDIDGAVPVIAKYAYKNRQIYNNR